MSLAMSPKVHAVTGLTPHSLISGAPMRGGKDPSLLPELDGKVLAIKDFTTILTMHYSVRDEIFGTLRDVYDGTTEKIFGNGVKRSYKVHFGIIAGVTPAIETFNIVHSSLGERFLKFRITGNWDHLSEDQKIEKALGNLGKEIQMRDELGEAAARYISFIKMEKIPKIPLDYKGKLIALAKFGARLR